MEKKFRIGINIAIIIGSFGAWLWMLSKGAGLLSAEGLRSLRYFTMLSNLLAGIAAILWLCRRDSRRIETLKYVAAVSVFLTFMVVMVFLGPLYGYPAMFVGGNFWLHLAVPLTAVGEAIWLSGQRYTRQENRLAMVPMILYGISYLSNNLINGIGEWPDTNDWYGFMMWGPAGTAVTFVVIGIVTWGLGWVIRKFAAKRL